MPQREVTIVNRLGLHARAAAKFVALAHHYRTDVSVSRQGRQVNGKSIMGVMMLAAAKGTQVVITTSGGHDAEEALDALCQLIADRFGEET